MNYDSLERKIEYVFQGRYDYLGRLGSGGMGTVCLVQGRDLMRGRYALKVIHKQSPENRDVDVYTEIHTLEGLRHPGIVSIYEAVEDADNVYIIQEYINGRSLVELRDDYNTVDAITEDTAMLWMIDVADALAYLHGCGIVHRDIKPGNIMVDNTGSARVIDFGLARRISTLRRSNGVTVGSAPYSPLERLEGEADGVKTDIYAFGVTFYSLIRRKIPSVSGREINTLRTGNKSVKPYYMNAYRSMIGDLGNIRNEGLRDIIRGCVETDPLKRISDFNTIRYRLRSLNQVEAVHTEKVRTVRRFHRSMIAVLLIGIMLTGLGLVQMKRDYDHRFEDILTKAEKSFSEADYTASEQDAREAITFNPGSAAGYIAKYRAETSYAYEMNDAASYEKLISETEDDWNKLPSLKDNLNAATYLANAYFESGKPDEAAAVLDDRDDLEDDQLMLLGQAWYEIGKNKKALSCVNRISGDVPQKYYLEGLIRQDTDQGQAIEDYEKVINTEDTEGGFTDLKRKAVSQIAQIYIDRGEYSRAAGSISSAIGDNAALQNSAKLNIMMMDCLYKAGDYSSAIDQANLVTDKFSNPGAFAVKCSSQLETGDSKGALDTIYEWEQAYPEDARPHVQNAIIFNRIAGKAVTDNERMAAYPDFIRVYEQEREWLVSHNEMNDEFRSLESPYMEARNILSQMEAES